MAIVLGEYHSTSSAPRWIQLRLCAMAVAAAVAAVVAAARAEVAAAAVAVARAAISAAAARAREWPRLREGPTPRRTTTVRKRSSPPARCCSRGTSTTQRTSTDQADARDSRARVSSAQCATMGRRNLLRFPSTDEQRSDEEEEHLKSLLRTAMNFLIQTCKKKKLHVHCRLQP